MAGLADPDRLALLAELAGLSLDLREDRTTSVRRGARAEAVEIAALCHADVTRHWTPDVGFLGAHPKSKLLGMLDEMGAEEPLARGARKDELVTLVAERAAERNWAPAYLSWAAEPPAGEDGDPPPDAPDASADATPVAETETGAVASPAAPPLAA